MVSISISNGRTLKIVVHFPSLDSNISSTENDDYIHIEKP